MQCKMATYKLLTWVNLLIHSYVYMYRLFVNKYAQIVGSFVVYAQVHVERDGQLCIQVYVRKPTNQTMFLMGMHAHTVL